MATLTTPRKTTDAEHVYHAINHVGLLTREEAAAVEAEIAVILAPAAPAAAPALPKTKSLLASMMGAVLALRDEVSGPPMTDLQRRERDLAEARHHCHPGLGGF